MGSDPHRRVLLPDTLSVRQLLELLPSGLRLEELGPLDRVGDALLAAGLLVDEDERTLLRQAKASTLVKAIVPETWHDQTTKILTEAGLGIHDDDTTPTDEVPRGPDLTLVVHDGEPDREFMDHLVRDEHPVLPVCVVDARVRVGPFTVLGSSPCLRCVDAHAAERDPWFRTRSETLPASSHGTQIAPLTLTQALLTATADLCAWAEGRQPMTWCATRSYDETLTVEHTAWDHHPYCGCTWAEGLVTA